MDDQQYNLPDESSPPADLVFGAEERACLAALIDAGLSEDLGQHGDITSAVLVPEQSRGTGELVVGQAGVLAGLEAAEQVFRGADPNLVWQPLCRDGQLLQPGRTLARVTGSLRALLASERLALNFIQRLSGIATQTRTYVNALEGTGCQLWDTRKTTPGWRVLEKYAVRVGGGYNHRMGLHDAVLIKDNHLVVWQRSAPGRSIAEAVRVARATVPPGTIVQIEVDSIDQFRQVVAARPDVVLLDNMSLSQLRQAVAIRRSELPELVLEASGGITLDNIRAVAETGVDRISVGAVTHSAPALDIRLELLDCMST